MLDQRYQACVSALRALMPDLVRWTMPGGGPTLWLDLPSHVNLAALQERALARGVDTENSSPAFFGAPHLHGFRISYAYVKPETMQQALETLAQELKKLM
jgi:DNA-binding transcriptional MocR family regulator